MKHLLIAASVLAMTAGVASADITFGGSANAGIAKNGTKNGGSANPNTIATTSTLLDGKYHAYSDFDLTVAASGTTASGLTFGVTDDIHAGPSYALAHNDGWNTHGGTLGTPSVYVSSTWGKVTFSANNLDAYNTDVSWSGSGDVSYAGTFGGLGVGLIADIESQALAVQGTYTMGGVSLSADYNQDKMAGYKSIWDASGSYTMGAFTGELSATNDNNTGAGGTFDTSETVKLTYASGGITGWGSYTTSYASTNGQFDLGGTYATGPYSVTVEVDDVTQANHGYYEWNVSGSYALSKSLSLTAGTNYTGDVMVGASMSF